MINKPKIVLSYIKIYLNEIAKLLSKVSDGYRILLPDHFFPNQEIEVYFTKDTGIAIDYVGLSSKQKVTLHKSDRCFDDLLFPATEQRVPCNQGALKLKPLSKSEPEKPITTLSFIGDMSGIVLLKIEGGGHLFAYDKQLMASNLGRHVFFNLYVQREYSDGSLMSKYVRYAELYPDQHELFTSAKAFANARKDFGDFLDIVTNPEFGPEVQKYVKIGDAVHKLKDNSIVVLGKDTPLLRRIRDELRVLKYNSFLVKEQPDIAGQSPEEKVKLYTLMSKFAVMEDSAASGHIAEFEYCKNNRVVLVVLRQRGKGSTWMIGDASLVDAPYIRIFEYTERNLYDVLAESLNWAESFIQKRVDAYEGYFQ